MQIDDANDGLDNFKIFFNPSLGSNVAFNVSASSVATGLQFADLNVGSYVPAGGADLPKLGVLEVNEATPEPSAALVFAVGPAIAGRSVRRR